MLNEDSFEYGFIKNIWCEIVPLAGRTVPIEGNVIQITMTHKITIRSNLMDQISDDMYFVYKKQRYDIEYFNPNYKYLDSIEIMVKLTQGVVDNR